MTIKSCCHTNGFKINDTFAAIAERIDAKYEHCWSSAGAYSASDDEPQHIAINIPADLTDTGIRAWVSIYESGCSFFTEYMDEGLDELCGGEEYEMTHEQLFDYLETIPKSIFCFAKFVTPMTKQMTIPPNAVYRVQCGVCGSTDSYATYEDLNTKGKVPDCGCSGKQTAAFKTLEDCIKD